jgi:hypothetical protein
MAFNIRNIDNRIIILTNYAEDKPAKLVSTVPGINAFLLHDECEPEEFKALEHFCKSLDPEKPILSIKIFLK